MNAPKAKASQSKATSVIQQLVRVGLPIALIIMSYIGYRILGVEPEEVKRPPAPPRTVKTKVESLDLQNYQTVIETRGVVKAHNEVGLTAEVSGRILKVLPTFEDGAFFAEGDVLLELNPVDFQTELLSADAQLARTTAALAQEEARGKQAKLNWDDLGYNEEANDLVLRLPQLREAIANVKTAQAQVEQAKRNLDRTKVRAPFDGRVRTRMVGLGQSVGPGTDLGTVFSVDYAEIRLPIAAPELQFLTLPEETSDPPVAVELRDALTESDTIWEAQIIRTEGALDESSRELFAIAKLVDPFGRKSGKKPLRIGQPVLAAVKGRILEQVHVLPRTAVRQLNRIFLVDENKLRLDRREITPIWRDEEHLVIRDASILDGALLATSYLNYTPDEAKVEIIPQEPVTELNADTDKEKPTGNEQTSTSTTTGLSISV